MKNRIACLVLCLVIVFSFASYSSTGAWFASGMAKHQYLSTGKINYLLAGEIVSLEDEEILPGVELVSETLTLENFSSIGSQLRVTIYFSYYDASGTHVQNEKYDDTNENSVLSVTLGTNWAKGEDGSYYYKSKDYVISARDEEDISAYEAGETVVYDNSATEDVITLLESLKFDEENTTITNSGKSANVKIVIESKQANYVTWSELGSITV